eukprot:11462748-Heterocapsa_arctica.AAC.1
MDKLWNAFPEYKGKVGQAVVDLGITHRVHTRASLNKALAVRDKVNIIKTGAQSKATYGAAVDPFTKGELNTLRGRFAEALWRKKYASCKATGLLLVDKGELEPGIAIVKNIIVNWLRQIE